MKAEHKKKLTAKQKTFVKEYLIDFNATQAAIRAGYSKKTAYSQGQRLLKKVEVQDSLQKQKDKRSARLEISADRTVLELAKIAYVDPRKFFCEDGTLKNIIDLDDNTAAALAGMDVLKKYAKNADGELELQKIQKIKMADKLAALRDLGKHQGIFQRDNEQQGSADLKTKQEFMTALLESISRSDRGLPKE